MRLFLSTIFALAITYSYGQNNGFTAKKTNNPGVKNIVINETTYNKVVDPSLNRRKLSNISDRKSGKPKHIDDPFARVLYEKNILKNPTTGQIPLNISRLEKEFVLSSASRLQNRLKTGGLSYTHSGPINVGGRTRALAIDKSDASKNTILAGGTTGGMWKSTNRGASWVRTTSLNDHPSVTAIAQDPNNTSIWYYTTGELIGSAGKPGAPYRGNGLFKSTDNGDSWTPLPATASNTSEVYDPFDYSWNICIDPNNSHIYIATSDGIKRSTNGGDSWSTVINSNSFYTDIICTPAGVKYATMSSDGATKGIYRSATGNSGDWENITPSGFPSNYNRIVLAHTPGNTSTDIIYLLGQTPDAGLEGHSFWKLTYTNSASWEDRSQNLPKSDTKENDVSGYNSQYSYNMVIKVAPDNEEMVFIGGTNLYRSDDAFATSASPLSDGVTNKSKTYWIGGYSTENDVSQYDEHHPDIHSLVFIDNNTLLCGHDGGISITTNCKQTKDSGTEDSNENTPPNNKPVDWHLLNNGYLTTQSYTVAIDHDITESKFILSGFQDNGTWLGRSALASEKWDYWGSGDGSFCSILNLGKHFLSSSQNGLVYLESDPAEPNWIYTRVDPEGAEGQLFINPFIVDANNSEIMYYAAGTHIWRNTNIFEIPIYQKESASKNWDKLEISSAKGTISALESSTFPAHILYYGTSIGKLYRINNSHSHSATRTEITGANFPNGNVISIDANPLNAAELLVAFSNYGIESVFYSKNSGESWTAVSGNLEDPENNNGPSLRSVSIMVSPTDTTYYAGTSTGLYSTNRLNGNSTVWTQEATNKIGTSIVAMIKSRRDGFIAAATHGNGVFTADADYSSSKPVALIGMTKDSIQIGESVNFMNRSIGDGFAKWEWTFEGAEPNSSTDEHPRGIVYNTPGKYQVSLKATNRAGNHTHTITEAIIVKSINANFSADLKDVNVGTKITFTNQSVGNPTSWKWSFPGGTPESSTEKNPVVTYNKVGIFDVSLTISNAEYEDTETKRSFITVLDPDDFTNKLLYNIEFKHEDLLSQFKFLNTNSGYVTGHNKIGLTDGSTTNITQYAEKFTITNPNLNSVKQVQINPSVVQARSSNPRITLKIWNGTTKPNDLVYQKDVPYSKLTARKFNVINLAFPVLVEKDFFVGYEIHYENPVDSFAVFHLPLETDVDWENKASLFALDEWISFPVFFNGPKTSLAIKALVGYEPGATGIKDELTKKTDDLLIYPNPMTHKSNVVFPNKNNQKYRLIVVDSSGRVVRIIENITGNNVIINREQLKPGLHFINLDGEKIYKGKLLVM